MSDDELSKQVEDVDIFARMNPLQKERIITILKKNGHVVGYMGDGVMMLHHFIMLMLVFV